MLINYWKQRLTWVWLSLKCSSNRIYPINNLKMSWRNWLKYPPISLQSLVKWPYYVSDLWKILAAESMKQSMWKKRTLILEPGFYLWPSQNQLQNVNAHSGKTRIPSLELGFWFLLTLIVLNVMEKADGTSLNEQQSLQELFQHSKITVMS